MQFIVYWIFFHQNFIGILRILSARKQRPNISSQQFFFFVFLRVGDVILLISELNFKCLLSSWSYWFTMLICMLDVEPTLALTKKVSSIIIRKLLLYAVLFLFLGKCYSCHRRRTIVYYAFKIDVQFLVQGTSFFLSRTFSAHWNGSIRSIGMDFSTFSRFQPSKHLTTSN